MLTRLSAIAILSERGQGSEGVVTVASRHFLLRVEVLLERLHVLLHGVAVDGDDRAGRTAVEIALVRDNGAVAVQLQTNHGRTQTNQIGLGVQQ